MKTSKILQHVGNGLCRALYSTYISYLPPQNFSYPIESKVDSRGKFMEILKTTNSGQFSYLSILPDKTRGNRAPDYQDRKIFISKR